MRLDWLKVTGWRLSKPARPLGLVSRVLVSFGLAGLIGAYLLVTIVPLFSQSEPAYMPAGYATTRVLPASYGYADAEPVPSDRWLFVGAESLVECGLTASGKLLDQFPSRADQSGLSVLIVKDGAGG